MSDSEHDSGHDADAESEKTLSTRVLSRIAATSWWIEFYIQDGSLNVSFNDSSYGITVQK